MNDQLPPFIEASVREAGAILLQHFRQPGLVIDEKSVGDLVTEADRASEETLVAAIQRRFPDHGILAEESGLHPGTAEFTWLLDPLEATFNYARGLPLWGINMVLTQHGRPIAGAFFDPLLGELYYAGIGEGASMNGRAIRSSGCTDIAAAAVYGSTSALISRLSGHVRKFRHIGSIGNALAYVAAGYLDGAIEVGGGPWDSAVGELLVTEAGGAVAGIGSSSLFPDGAFLAAATPTLLERLRELLSM